MEETYTTKAIVLRREPHKERDSRITALSADRGKLTLVVRGTRDLRSKLAGHIEPLNLVNFMVIRGRRCDYAGNAVSENCYAALKRDAQKSILAGCVLGFVDRFFKAGETADSEIFFALLRDYLDCLDADAEGKVDGELAGSFFIYKTLAHSGLKPELYACLKCGRTITAPGNYFSPERGGIVCGRCRSSAGKNSLPISDNCVKILKIFATGGLRSLREFSIDRPLREELIKIIGSFKEYHTDTDP